MSYIEIHIIQTMPPCNPNRGQNGEVKSVTIGGTERARLSSQSQKHAARAYYKENALVRSQLGNRSRRHWINLAPLLTEWAEEGDRQIIAKLVLGLFNFGAEKLLPSLLEDESNLVFLANSEIETLAMLTNQNKDLFADWLERGKEFLEISAQRDEKGKSAKVKDYDRQLTKGDIGKFAKSIVTQFKSTTPGEVALFGRMMATLTESSVDGSVQVSHASGLSEIPRTRGSEGYATGNIDFFAACDDITPLEGANGGAGMIGEVRFTAPTYYRYANVNVDQFLKLVGDEGKEMAPDMIGLFIEGFVKTLPTGYQTSFAHQTMPVFVLIQVNNGMPFQYSAPFENAIAEPIAGKSISEIGVQKLVEYRKEAVELFSTKDEYPYQAVTALKSHYGGAVVSLDSAIAGAIKTAIG
jgi:CRISPR system Cascade subunit CasC